MTYALKTPLALNKMDGTATFYRTHLGHRENATSLAIKLIRRAVAIEKVEVSGDVLAEELVADRRNLGNRSHTPGLLHRGISPM